MCALRGILYLQLDRNMQATPPVCSQIARNSFTYFCSNIKGRNKVNIAFSSLSCITPMHKSLQNGTFRCTSTNVVTDKVYRLHIDQRPRSIAVQNHSKERRKRLHWESFLRRSGG